MIFIYKLIQIVVLQEQEKMIINIMINVKNLKFKMIFVNYVKWIIS